MTTTHKPNSKSKVSTSRTKRPSASPGRRRSTSRRGRGPFPGILFVHGGAWNAGNRTQQEIFNTGLASSGLVMASVDFRLAPDDPRPAQVQDTRCGIKMAKAHASEFNASPDSGGGAGASSGGHTLMPSMRSHDPLFTRRRRPRRDGGLRDSRLAAVGLLRPLPVRPGYP